MLSLTQKQIDRFWGHVDKNSSPIFYNGTRCWIWTAFCYPNGYGLVGLYGKNLLPHRISYELFFGDIPEGLLVLHHCDNRPCCNPSHLFLGTHQDNEDDKSHKGRQAKGEMNGNHKLTDAQVSEIRHRYARYGIGGENMYVLAKEFEISPKQICRIVNNKSR